MRQYGKIVLLFAFAFAIFLATFFVATSFAQIEDNSGPDLSAVTTVKKQKPVVNFPQTPQWQTLFYVWAHQNGELVRTAMRDKEYFNNLSQLIGCDYWEHYHNDDTEWPVRQVQIVQKFNQHALKPPELFRIALKQDLGEYDVVNKQFLFSPLINTAFDFPLAESTAYGVDVDRCEVSLDTQPYEPWPKAFQLYIDNADFIDSLPMKPQQANIFLNNRKKSDGSVDRSVIVEVEVEVGKMLMARSMQIQMGSGKEKTLTYWVAPVTVKRAVVFDDAKRRVVLAKYGF